jgi:hypothetical protein
LDSNLRLICLARGLLSNRLKSLASAYALAKKLDRVLYVDWPDDERVLSLDVLFKEKFREFCLHEDEHSFDSHTAFYSSINTIKAFNPSLLSLANSAQFFEISADEDFVSNARDICIYYSDFYPGIDSVELRDFFKKTEFGFILKESLSFFLDKADIGLNTPSVHMRGRDFPCRELNLLLYYWRIKATIGDSSFFLATDDDAFREYIQKRCKGCTIASLQNLNISTNGDQIQSKLNKNLEGLLDQLILSQTNLKIFDRHSTFSHVALLLSSGIVLNNPKVGLVGKTIALIKHYVNRIIQFFWKLK